MLIRSGAKFDEPPLARFSAAHVSMGEAVVELMDRLLLPAEGR